MKASVGRIVHITDEGECQAALVIGLNGDSVDLAVFHNKQGYLQKREIFSDGAAEGNWTEDTWHWPERVE